MQKLATLVAAPAAAAWATALRVDHTLIVRRHCAPAAKKVASVLVGSRGGAAFVPIHLHTVGPGDVDMFRVLGDGLRRGVLDADAARLLRDGPMQAVATSLVPCDLAAGHDVVAQHLQAVDAGFCKKRPPDMYEF